MNSKEVVYLTGLVILFSSYIMFCSLMIMAWLGGGETIVNINKFNEGNLELGIMIVTLPAVCYVISILLSKEKMGPMLNKELRWVF
jgi:hypothetical protein